MDNNKRVLIAGAGAGQRAMQLNTMASLALEHVVLEFLKSDDNIEPAKCAGTF